MCVCADARVADWPLMSSPWPTVTVTLTYLIVVAVGPSLMNCRSRGFEFRGTLFCFNAALVTLNLYIFIEVGSMSGHTSTHTHTHTLARCLSTVLCICVV